MTPEERKAFVMRPGKKWSVSDPACEQRYPECCTYHEGVDDVLRLLVQNWPGHGKLYSIEER